MNFLKVRLNVEEDNTISKMSYLLASAPEEMIDTGRPLVELVFGNTLWLNAF
jgi:hypothetical protein